MPLSVTNPDFVSDREYSGMWGLVVYEIPRDLQSPFRRALLSMPRFRGNPNKLHDATAELPYVFHGLKRGESVFLDEELGKLGAQFETGPQEWLLDESMIPLAADLRGPRPSIGDPESDVEVLSAVPGSSWEIRYDGGRPSRTDLKVSKELLPSKEARNNGRYGTQPSMPPLQRLVPQASPSLPVAATAPSPQLQARSASPRPMSLPAAPSPSPPTPPSPARSTPDDIAPLASNDDYLWQKPPETSEPLEEAFSAYSSQDAYGAEAPTLDPGDLQNMAWQASQMGSEAEAEAVAAATVAPLPPAPAAEPAPAFVPETEHYDDSFAIVSINEIPGRKFHIGAIHTTISVSANELDVGSQTSIDVALEQAHAILQQRAEELGGTGIVGLRVTQSAIPTKAGWMLVLVVSGTAVA